MDIEKLSEIGFTKNQARVYIMLIKQPGKSVGQISKELSIDRSFVYGVLESLTKKGFIYFALEKNKKRFYAENPKKIIEDLREKESKTIEIVSELVKLRRPNKKISSMEVYEGKQALKKYIREIIGSKEFLTLGGGGKLNLFNILKYEHPHYFKELKIKKTFGKVICSQENKEFWKSNLKDTNIEIKSLKGAGKENSITILENKTIFSLETENPQIIFINNSDHSNSLKH